MINFVRDMPRIRIYNFQLIIPKQILVINNEIELVNNMFITFV